MVRVGGSKAIPTKILDDTQFDIPVRRRRFLDQFLFSPLAISPVSIEQHM
jgi:hypothetical protein